MQKLTLFFTIILFFNLLAGAQTKVSTQKVMLSEHTVVKDTAGVPYPYAVWQQIIASGNYLLKADNPGSDSTAYVLTKMGAKQKSQLINNMTKPAESMFFTTGEKIKSFTAHDIEGNKIKLKDLEGKVVVLALKAILQPTLLQRETLMSGSSPSLWER